MAEIFSFCEALIKIGWFFSKYFHPYSPQRKITNIVILSSFGKIRHVEGFSRIFPEAMAEKFLSCEAP